MAEHLREPIGVYHFEIVVKQGDEFAARYLQREPLEDLYLPERAADFRQAQQLISHNPT